MGGQALFFMLANLLCGPQSLGIFLLLCSHRQQDELHNCLSKLKSMFASYCCDRHYDQNQSGEWKGLFGFFFQVEIHYWWMGAGTEAETIKESCLLACSPSDSGSPRFLIQLTPTCLGIYHHSGLVYQLAFKKMIHRHGNRPVWSRQCCIWGSLIPGDTRLYQLDYPYQDSHKMPASPLLGQANHMTEPKPRGKYPFLISGRISESLSVGSCLREQWEHGVSSLTLYRM